MITFNLVSCIYLHSFSTCQHDGIMIVDSISKLFIIIIIYDLNLLFICLFLLSNILLFNAHRCNRFRQNLRATFITGILTQFNIPQQDLTMIIHIKLSSYSFVNRRHFFSHFYQIWIFHVSFHVATCILTHVKHLVLSVFLISFIAGGKWRYYRRKQCLLRIGVTNFSIVASGPVIRDQPRYIYTVKSLIYDAP